MIYCFTSINAAYLPNARILAASVKTHHPEWRFVLLLSDTSPRGVVWAEEPFDEIFFADQLPVKDFRKWSFQYNVIELCTAVKGVMAEMLLDRPGASGVVYLDPDTVVYSRLEEIEELLQSKGFILTPHITDAETSEEGVLSHEIAALKHGTFNLGFFAVSQLGRAPLRWWAKRLLDYSYIDFSTGLFTDQKWGNLMPYIFDNVYVLTSRGYNVATWNIEARPLTSVDGQIIVGGEAPLRFYHFSGFGHNFAWADRELKIFAAREDLTVSLWDWYKEHYEVSRLAYPHPWAWGFYRSGEPIPDAHRRIARTNVEAEAILDPLSTESYRLLSTIAKAGNSPRAEVA